VSDLKGQAQLAGRILVLADAVMPSTGQVAPVGEYLQMLERREQAALLLFDDAHGFGVLGEHGRGLLEAVGLWERTNTTVAKRGVSIHVCGTLSKALGGFGGIIPGTRQFLAQVRKSSHYFEGASAPPSAAAAGTSKALEIILQQPALRARLRENVQRIRNGLRELGVKVPGGETAHVGVVTGDANHMRGISEALRKRLIFVPYITSYAGVPPEGLLRFAVFATHSTDQIDLLLSELRALV
jgi:7-keto-8-aminopelargonate synthetase-like enzyme